RPVPSSELDPADVTFDAFGAGGPGGQHQNKTASAVRAVHKPSGLAVVVREGRSQHPNKAIAFQPLRTPLKPKYMVTAEDDHRQVQSGHSRLERGRPIRTFAGKEFRSR